MKQLVSIQMDGGLNAKKQTNCGFDLCPKKFKYLANPSLLDRIFSDQTMVIEPKSRYRRPDSEYSMETRACLECGKEYLLPLDVPICIGCRGIYQ